MAAHLVAPCPAGPPTASQPALVCPVAEAVAEPTALGDPPLGEPPTTKSTGAPPLADDQEIVIVAHTRSTPSDSLETMSRKAFEITEAVDVAIVGPAARRYEKIVPKPIRNGLRNALGNLQEPVIFLNFVLQAKIGKSVETLGRFVINSTVGVAGLFDMAKRHPFLLPFRPNGFADSFGYYGLKPGRYMFLPLIGPTTVRDLIGDSLDRLILPTVVGYPFSKLTFSVPVGVERALDHRASFDERLSQVREQPDPYVARRELYLRGRQAEIETLRGRDMAGGEP